MAVTNTGVVFGTAASSVRHTPYSSTGSPGGGWLVWSTPSNAEITDAVFATVQQTSSAISAPGIPVTEALVVSGFGLSLPTNAAIVGIEVTVRGKTSINASSNPFTTSADVALLLDKTRVALNSSGSIPFSVGDSSGTAGASLTTTLNSVTTSTYTAGADDPDIVYGGQCSPLSGTTTLTHGTSRRWTASDLNSANFGVALTFSALPSNALISIDSVGLKVYYIPGSTGKKLASTVANVTPQLYNTTTSPSNGVLGWTNPSNALTINGSEASVTQFSSAPFACIGPLVFSGFSFSIPTSIILGIRVFITARTGPGDSATVSAHLLLDKDVIGLNSAGTALVGNTSATGPSLTASSASYVVGGAADAWSGVAAFTSGGAGGSLLKGSVRAWDIADFNATTFAVAITPNVLPSGNRTFVDSVSIEVFFDESARTKLLGFSSSESASIAPSFIRSRKAASTITESTTLTSTVKRDRHINAAIAEFLNYAVGVSKSSSGPTSTGATNPTTSSGTGWTGTANIYAQDGSNATITPVTTGSAPLKAQGFGFAIPAGATINGISFDAYAYQAGGTSGTIDVEVRALKADGSASSSSASTTSINTTASYKTYGSSSSLWGETWTYADINDADFGVQIIPTAVSGGGGGSTTSGYAVAGTASSTTETSGTWGPNTSSLVNDVANADSAFVYYQMGSLAATDTRNPFLTLTNFGFSIPTGATISAVEVSVNRRFNDSGGGVSCKFDTVKLVVGGTAVGTNKATTTTWPSTYSYDTFGDTTSDLWGNTLSPADVNASDFGVTMRAIAINSNTDGTARIDHVRVRVTYTSPSSPDRVFTVDHVRATVNYTPVDQTAKLVTFSLAETGSTSFGSFTRGRTVPFTSTETNALTTAVNRNRTVSTTVTQLYDVVLDIIRARNVPINITIAEVEQILSNLQVTRAPVTTTQSPTAISEGTGTYGWTNTSNVFVQDGAVAYIDPHTTGNKPLRVTNFGYSLVPGVTVLGVKFEAYAYQSGGTVGTVDVQAKLIKADGTTTTASETITAINTVPSYKTYGSSSSLWGTTLTGADINDVDFGIEITPIGVAGGGPTSTGLVNPGSVSQVTGNLSRSWTNITNVLAADGSYTSLQTDISPGDSTFIVPSNFGLSIPAGSTIDGIEVTVTAYGTTTGSGNVLFDTVQLTSAGSPIGTGQSSNEIVHASTATATTFGGAANTWGATLTDTVVNSSTFGVRVRFKDDGQFTTENVFVDSIQLKVYYTQTAIPPDRRLNVDHVRAIVTYTPIDLKSLGAIVVSYLEAMSAASNRTRRVVPTITEVETATAAVKRARLASFAVPETMTLTTALSRLKQVAITLAESVGHTFTASRLRQLQQQSITELETFSFGSLRRIRNVITSLQETTTTVANVIRARALPLTVAEQEAITEAIGLARKLAVTLNEQLVVTPQLSRKKQIAAAIAEVETLSATYIKVKFMVAAINYVESVATTNIIRTRALAPLIAEVEADAVALGRSRKISTVIPQTETVQSTLARFRKALVSVLEQESIAPITTARLRGVIAQLHEQEQFDVALSIILASASPEVIGVTMTWYEQEVKIDGTVNYKLMSETWNVKRSADIVTVDIAVPATQIINI